MFSSMAHNNKVATLRESEYSDEVSLLFVLKLARESLNLPDPEHYSIKSSFRPRPVNGARAGIERYLR
jgi:hypothetical protein